MVWFDSLKDNYSFSDVIAFLSMIGAIVAAIFAWINKKKSAKSEDAVKKYYDEMLVHLEKQNKESEKEKMKKKIMGVMDAPFNYTSKISEKTGISEDDVKTLLDEMRIEKRVQLDRTYDGWKRM